MPQIFDNIDHDLLPALQETLKLSERSDFCVGYFNLRGWKHLDSYIDKWAGGDGNCCRLLVGMHRYPEDELRELMGFEKEGRIDNQTALKLKKQLAEQFREQLTIGAPTNQDEIGLQKLARQIKDQKVKVKLFLHYPLHAKLYLLFRPDPINPTVSYLGSSNLTFAGLSKQGELNVDVMDRDACEKLAHWFEDRWNDHWCIDISQELVEIIEESWAGEDLIPPYHIYIKIAYHLAQEARAGLSEFRIPKDFGNKLFDFQQAAVKIAAHHLNRRNGVIIGDVVGLGKTLMATALARIFEDDHFLETLIICPKNLVKMWEDYRHQYRLRAKVLSISQVISQLPELRRYRLIILDESHNLRNREGKRYRAIREYIQENESKCILLSATPYNKTYLDLSSQLRLFVPEDQDIGIRPEMLIRQLGEIEFARRHQCPLRSLAAFEKSEHIDDWRELMRLYLVRRTRSFIKENYAHTDSENGRQYLIFEDGTRSYFPERVPQTLRFTIEDRNPNDQYALLYSSQVVNTINGLNLPRYGLANYLKETHSQPPTQNEAKIIEDLSRAGKRLMGFCRTNLFKRLESSGYSFILSIKRHILRNYVFIYAIERDLPLPIGPQDTEMLDSRLYDTDRDEDVPGIELDLFDGVEDDKFKGIKAFENLAEAAYQIYADKFQKRFKWLRHDLFSKSLAKNLRKDVEDLFGILKECGMWDPKRDAKLDELQALLQKSHPDEKVIVFTQFANTVDYLHKELKAKGISQLEGVTGDSPDPTGMAWRFSPISNKKQDQIESSDELRVLISTDVLSEGQNLQDCSIVVNYDLPWAIIRLVQRAGRVDRIGQQAEEILCYSFLPADGVERILRLRARVRQRLRENAEVVGTDEAFFEDDEGEQNIIDLYNEKAGILDGEAETEVDLASYAYQIWKNATDRNPKLKKIIPELPDVVYSTRDYQPSEDKPEGVLVYLRTADGADALKWLDKDAQSVTESQFVVLKAAECAPETTVAPRHEKHHELVKKSAELILEEEKTVGGGLGNRRGARFRSYERLKRYIEEVKGTLFETEELKRAIDTIYRHPLKEYAKDALNRQMRSGASDQTLAELVVALWGEDRLCAIHEEERSSEPKIICSMGLFQQK